MPKSNFKKGSWIWKYFGKDDVGRKIATCLKCRKVYQTSGNTSNLMDHLKRSHGITKASQNKSSSSFADSSTSGSETSPKKKRKTTSLRNYFEKTQMYSPNDKNKRERDVALIEMVARDMQPFSVVEDKGFIRFCKKLDPKYKLPSRNHLKEKLLPEMYDSIMNKLSNCLKHVKHVSLTTDIWTNSFTTESYITFTCHFVWKNELISCILETTKIEGQHTAVHISSIMEDVISRWSLTNKVVCIVTDNAANMVAACRNLNISHIGCFAHTINLVVQDGLHKTENLEDILKKCRNIVAFFKRSVLASDKLREQQENANQPRLKLLQDVSTRWNSVFYMLNRILTIGDCLTITQLNIPNCPEILSANEKLVLHEIINILEPFENATQQISGKYVTVSLIIPLITGLYHSLNELRNTLQTPIASNLWNQIMKSMNSRLTPYESMLVPKVSTLLDPRFKKNAFKNKDNSLTAQAEVQKMAQASLLNVEATEVTTTPEAQPSTSVSRLDNPSTSIESNIPLFSYLTAQRDLTKSTANSSAKAIISVRQYLETELADLKQNPLLYWSNSENKILAEIAMKFFTVPATSVESERLFSKSGQLLSARRSRLKPKNVNMLLFIGTNFEFYERNL